MKHPK